MEYRVDLRDVKFHLFEWLPTAKLFEHEKFSEWDPDSLSMVVEEALKIAQEQLAPANEEGDRIGARYSDGKVTLPESFKTAWEKIREGGWIGLIANPEWGGMGAPHVFGTAVTEFFTGANSAFNLTVGLTMGAGEMIERFGTDEMKQLFVEKLYSGEWAGTMCLTEPQAGSDVGAIKTKAVKQADGRYLLSGEKIFITAGDHDLTENIVHLVLAKVPGAPPGTKGISLFVVPKFRVNPDGSLGEPNDVYTAGIEEKMGIHGSPTCSLVFGQNDACEGFLLGEENQGLKLMFHLMNAARIEVGLQGGALAGAAHQAAMAYAKERLQSRHWTKLKEKDAPQVPIIEHPDVRRMLLWCKAYTEAIRALLYITSYYIDMTHVTEGEEKEQYQTWVDVLTPICKAWGSHWGLMVTNTAMEVFGGYGYTREYPAEQYMRDCKIACIYEGTNGIQALDFVARKLPMKGGKPVMQLMGMAEKTFKKLKDDPQLGEPAWLLAGALKVMQTISQELQKRKDGILVTILDAFPMLDMAGTILGAHFLLDQAALAKEKLGGILEAKGVDPKDEKAYKALLAADDEAAYYHDKIQTAIHFCYRALPLVNVHAAAIRSGELAPINAMMD